MLYTLHFYPLQLFVDFPVYFRLFGLEINPHLVFEILAYSLGFRYYLWLRRHTTDLISTSDRLWIFIGAAAGGFIGSRLLGIVEDPTLWTTAGHISSQPLLRQYPWLLFFNSKTIVGGLLGGLIGVEWTKKWIGVHTSSGDLMVYPLIFGIAIGRIGCFLAGVTDGTHGIPCHSGLWCMDLGDGILRHPTALYESIYVIILGIAIYTLEHFYTLTNGSRFKIFLATYLLFRFGIEFIKPVYRFPIGLSSIQLACLAGLVYYYRIFLVPKQLFAGKKVVQSLAN